MDKQGDGVLRMNQEEYFIDDLKQAIIKASKVYIENNLSKEWQSQNLNKVIQAIEQDPKLYITYCAYILDWFIETLVKAIYESI